MKSMQLIVIMLALAPTSASAGLYTNLALASAASLMVKGESVKCKSNMNTPDCAAYAKGAQNVSVAKTRIGNAVKALKGRQP